MDIANIVKKIKKDNRQEKKYIADKIKLALEEVRRLKEDFLKIDPKLEKIVLFGSLAENRINSIDFDIDIAVLSDKYYLLTARALESDFKVDVVDLDTVNKLIKENIIKNGKVVYEQR